MATVLDFGNKSRDRGGCPSFIVLKEMTDAQRSRYLRQGLVPIKASGEEFFSILLEDYLAFTNSLPHESERESSARVEVLSKFKKLSASEIPPRRLIDFYAVADTQWAHIVNNLDAPFREAASSADWLCGVEPGEPRIAVLHGGEVSGKSATALRIGMELIGRGMDVLVFRGEERFSVDLLSSYLSARENVALIFDDGADFSGSIKEVVAGAIESGINLRAVITCESSRIRAVKADLNAASCLVQALDPLGRANFLSILEKRQQKGRLGKWTGISQNEGWKEFTRAYGGRLLEWLEALENAQQFRDRIVAILGERESGSSAVRRLVFATAMVHRLGFALPYYIANDYAEGQSLEDLIGEGGLLSDLCFLDEKGMRLRSSAFARFAWGKVPAKDKYEVSLAVCRELAPLVVPKAISRRSYEYQILKSLMAHEVVHDDHQGLGEDWYQSLEKLCGWNSRFWEQRALLASKQRHEERAYSYARKAVSIHGRDPFVHTTLGKVCVKIGVSRNDDAGVERFWEGEEALRYSRTIAREQRLEWEHPYITFFTYALQAAQSSAFKDEMVALTQAWSDWMNNARNSASVVFPEVGDNSLAKFQRDWLAIAVKRGSP